MDDFWGVSQTKDKQGINQLKSDIKDTYEWGKKKVEKHRNFIKIKIEKSKARKVLAYMDKNDIEYEL